MVAFRKFYSFRNIHQGVQGKECPIPQGETALYHVILGIKSRYPWD